jgi:uncharacterized protein (UPF0276 family)
MQKEDYTLLSWLLQRSTPRAITLEYWKDPAHHAEQLKKLTKLIQI